MLTQAEFRALLRRRGGYLVVDGALATELECRGHNLNHPLWSGKVLREAPEGIENIHYDYYLAGADIAITSSYQTSTQGLQESFSVSEDEAVGLIKQSVRLAQRARCRAYSSGNIAEDRRLLIAGSVGPYGAYLADGSEYRGDYQRTNEAFQAFHRPRIRALIDSGVDILALETMPSRYELVALFLLLEAEFPDSIAWVGCTLEDTNHLSDGTPLPDVLRLVSRYPQIVAFGTNCVPIQLVSPAIGNMKRALSSIIGSDVEVLNEASLAQHHPPALLCYPNSGEEWDAKSKVWHGDRPAGQSWTALVEDWRQAGAQLIGGCCRTGPKDIKDISNALSIHCHGT